MGFPISRNGYAVFVLFASIGSILTGAHRFASANGDPGGEEPVTLYAETPSSTQIQVIPERSTESLVASTLTP